jgi:MFS superfamily sulfate permease-like transporter/mannitol/fructose-specific phosphotransferase system IIA component (Ntr-type)
MTNALSKNLLASIVIFLVALPLNLGIALASGVSPSVGILSGIVAGIVVGALAGCPLQVSGPAAGLIAIVWQIVDAHGLEMLGPVVLAAGILQICLGVSGLAPWFRAVAPSVIQGMLAGIGVLIGASQFQVMLEQKPQVSGLANLAALPGAIWTVLSEGTGHPSAFIGFTTIAVIVAWAWVPKRFKIVPGSLMGVAAAVVLALVFQPAIQYVTLPSDGLPELTMVGMSQLSGLLSLSVLGSILALAFVATAQTLLTATAVDRMHNGDKTDYNREVLAQGAGNTVCGALGLLPISGVIVRSATNVEAGATGRVSAVMHGVWIALFFLFLSPLLGYVPLPALAAVLVYTGYRLVNVKAIKNIRKFGRAELAIYLVTLGGVVGIDLLSGIVLGFVCSAAHLIYTVTHCEVSSHEDAETGTVVVEMRGSATFFTLPRLADELAQLEQAREVHLFLSGLNYIDHACLEHIMGWEEAYIEDGGEVYIEWDHLIKRFKTPRSASPTDLEQEALPRTRSHETYDVLASRARVMSAEKGMNWGRLCDLITRELADTLSSQQLRLVNRGLQEQLMKQNFPVVNGVAMPHLMLPGLRRKELVVVQPEGGMSTLDPTSGDVESLVILVGPKDFTEHSNILARLSSRAEENLASDLSKADSVMAVRETLLRHETYVTVSVGPEEPTAELAGKMLWQLSDVLPQGSLVGSIYRDGFGFVPTGTTAIQMGDRLLILGSQEASRTLFSKYVKHQAEQAEEGAAEVILL